MLIRWLLGYPRPGHTNKEDNNAPTSPPPTSPSTSTPPPPPPHTHTHTPTLAALPQPEPPRDNSLFSRRSLRQMGLMLGGAGFFYWSVMISKRAAMRHQLAAKMRFFQGNQFMWRSQKELGAAKREPLVAAEALALATLNTASFAIFAAGGVTWALDVSSVEDLRRYARRSIERSVVKMGKVDEEAEREVVEWFGKTFGGVEGEKKDGGGEKGGSEGETAGKKVEDGEKNGKTEG